MKKIIFILLFFPIMYLYAQENIVFYTDNFGFHKYTITKDKIIFEDEDRQISEEYNRNDFKLAENGFCYHPQIDFDNEEDTIRYKEFIEWLQKNTEEDNSFFPFEVFKTKYTASSELKEGKIIYSANNLGTLFLPPDSREGSSEWNPGHKPWVEGKTEYGENEFIQIKTEKSFKSLEILNGYVDPDRTDLYKKNSRVKIFTIKDVDNNLEFDVHLDDCVYLHKIYLKQPTTNLILYIKDVYKGDKWDDTCVSSIIPLLE